MSLANIQSANAPTIINQTATMRHGVRLGVRRVGQVKSRVGLCLTGAFDGSLAGHDLSDGTARSGATKRWRKRILRN